MKLELRKVLHNLGAMSDLAADISSVSDFGEVTRTSLHTLLGTLAIPRGAIARLDTRPRRLEIIAAKGLTKVVGDKVVIAADEVGKLTSHPRPLLLKTGPGELKAFVSRNHEAIERLRAELMVPMVVHGEMMGAIFLSEKFTQQAYDDDDLAIIDAMARHIGIALYNHRLLDSLKRKADESRRLYREMRQIYRDTVRAFGVAIDLKDTYTSGHSDRVARYSEAIAREMGVTGKELEYIRVAGYLHDIGKIVVDRSIINNPRPLTDREYRELNRHVTTGYEILKHIRQPWKEIAYMTKCHHEKVDGSGYPEGLKGDEIPLGSRIVTLADSFDAMMTDRPYRARLALDLALQDVRDNSGKHFDGAVVAAFCRLLLKEISGAARERVVLPMIGLKFDRARITEMLSAMLKDLDSASSAPAIRKAAVRG